MVIISICVLLDREPQPQDVQEAGHVFQEAGQVF